LSPQTLDLVYATVWLHQSQLTVLSVD